MRLSINLATTLLLLLLVSKPSTLRIERKDTQRPLFEWFCDLVQGDPETPDHQDKLGGKKQKQPESKMEKRNKVYKVRLSDTELQKLRDGNVENIARFLRESAIAAAGGREQKQVYTKLDREFLLELSRIGNNINQVAKALNTDIAKGEPFDAVRLLHLLIAINENLEGLREDLK